LFSTGLKGTSERRSGDGDGCVIISGHLSILDTDHQEYVIPYTPSHECGRDSRVLPTAPEISTDLGIVMVVEGISGRRVEAETRTWRQET
jgi:hypothetical protein